MMKRESGITEVSVYEAEAVALRAVGFLASDQSYMADFLSRSGVSPDALADLIENHEFLTGVLDHLLSDESLLLAFCGNAGIDPSVILPARNALTSCARV